MRASLRFDRPPGRLAAAVLLGAALVPPSWVAAGPPLCPFRLLTGLPCPGCGLTRSVVSLAHGDLAAALTFHPLGPLLIVGLLGVLIAEAWPPSTRESGATSASPRSPVALPARLAA